MVLSTAISTYSNAFGDEKAIRLCKEYGYDAYDMSFFRMFSDENDPMNQPDYREYAKHLREVADEIGIVCNQAHAPFHSSQGDEKDGERFDAIVRSIEAAAILGAKAIVVHPKQHLSYKTEKAALWEMNLEFYRALAPFAKQFGIKIALENMWQYNNEGGRIIDSVCSRPEEFKAYLDELNDDCFIACLDIGHAAVTDEDIPHFIRTLGRDYLLALHVHDVDHKNDNHTLPYTAKINWDEVTSALAEIDYQGDLTFEADVFVRQFPKAVWDEASILQVAVGRHLINEIERKRNA